VFSILIIIEFCQLRHLIYSKEEETYLSLNSKAYDNAYSGAPIKWRGEENNTSALYGLETNITQQALQNSRMSNGRFMNSEVEYTGISYSTEMMEGDNVHWTSLYQVLERLRKKNKPDYIWEILNNAHKKSNIRDVFKFEDIDRKIWDEIDERFRKWSHSFAAFREIDETFAPPWWEIFE